MNTTHRFKEGNHSKRITRRTVKTKIGIPKRNNNNLHTTNALMMNDEKKYYTVDWMTSMELKGRQ